MPVIPEFKECGKCKIIKPKEDFRVRLEKRGSRSFQYLNTTCRICDAAYTRNYHHVRKDDPLYKKKNCDETKAWAAKNPDKIKARWQKNKYDAAWQVRLKNWRINNKERVKEKHRVPAREWSRKQKDGVTDHYILSLLHKTGIPRDLLRQHDEFIKAYQAYIIFKRSLKSKNNKQWIISYNSERIC